MLKNLTGNNKYLKRLNQTKVMDLIRIHRKISRTQISKYTGLSATAVGLIISELMKQGKIIETGAAESTGGRKQIFLALNSDYMYSIGVDFDINGITFILINISCNVLHKRTIPFPRELSIQDAFIEVNNVVIDILHQFSIGKDKLMGIGFSLPGLIDIQNKRTIITPNLGWNNSNVVDIWHAVSDIPVQIVNEGKSSAICEHWIGSCQQIHNFICINIKSGIGSGIFINGKLYHGFDNYAGEVGHIVVDENGPLCGCGNYGCLETFSSAGSIIGKYKELVKNGEDPEQLTFVENNKLDLDFIISAAKNGDIYAEAALLHSAKYLAKCISSIVKTLNPEVIVIGKEFTKYSSIVMQHIADIVYKQSIRYPSSNLKIKTSTFEGLSSAIGAAIIPTQRLFGATSFEMLY